MNETKIYSNRDFPSYLPKLSLLYDDLFSGGKGFRAKLIHYFAAGLSMPDRTERLLAQTIEFIHNASLLHDDLIDHSSLRRGKTAAWLKYTPEYAVLGGDYLLARVMVNLSEFGNIALISYTANMISDLLEGEWIQDSLVGDFNLNLSQLDQVHQLKTGSLFNWCFRAPFIALHRIDPKLHQLLEEMSSILGLLFQRSDDLLDFNVRNGEGKAQLGDLKSGYMNSFTCFLFQGLSAEVQQRARTCLTLPEFVNSIGSEYFDQKLKAFDELNQKKAARYQILLIELQTLLKEYPQHQQLIASLSKLDELLYWRGDWPSISAVKSDPEPLTLGSVNSDSPGLVFNLMAATGVVISFISSGSNSLFSSAIASLTWLAIAFVFLRSSYLFTRIMHLPDADRILLFFRKLGFDRVKQLLFCVTFLAPILLAALWWRGENHRSAIALAFMYLLLVPKLLIPLKKINGPIDSKMLEYKKAVRGLHLSHGYFWLLLGTLGLWLKYVSNPFGF